MRSATRNEVRHCLGWLLVPVLVSANGAVRDATYGTVLDRTLAHSLAVAPLVASITVWALILASLWPLGHPRSPLRVGAAWLVLTVLAELGLGVARSVTASGIAGEYDVLAGNLWILVPLAAAFAPALARRLLIVGDQGEPGAV